MNNKKAIALLRNSAKILLVGAHNWQLDDMAGLLGLESLLSESKEVLAVSPDKISAKLSFLPNFANVQKTLQGGQGVAISIDNANEDGLNYEIVDGKLNIFITDDSGKISRDLVSVQDYVGKFDLIVTIGVNALEDCGEIFAKNTALFSNTTVLNISNNPANEMFGNVNLINASASSVSEILANLVMEDAELKKSLNKTSINAFFAGISASTDNFLSAKTSSRSLSLAAELQSRGADHSQIIEYLFKRKSAEQVQVLGRMLNNLQLDLTHRMSWTSVSQSDFELAEATPNDLDSWTEELLRHINGADFLANFVEYPDHTLVQLRAEMEDFDFSDLESDFNLIPVPFGVDFVIPKKSVAEVQAVVLRKFADFQESRLGLSADTDIVKVDIYAEYEKQKALAEKNAEQNPAKFSPKKSASAPEEVPFIIPMK